MKFSVLKWQRLFLLPLIFVALAGCAQQSRPPHTLRLGATSDISSLDPAHAYDTGSIPYVRILYRGLVDYGKGAEIVNAVAREWKVSPDGKTYSFKLRKDVRFHSGRRVVAEDFRYALERVLDPATASDGFSLYNMIDGADEFSADRAKPKAQQRLKHVRGINVRGEDEISYTLKYPDVTFINWLAMPFAYAVPREAVEKWGDKGLNEHPDGCGPFKLESWVHDRHAHFVKNPDYYDKNLPKCERIELQMGGDDMLQLMRFEVGDRDLLSLEDVAAPDFIRLLQDAKWKQQIEHAPMGDTRYVALNTEMKPFDNVLVRRAVNHAINRERIVMLMTGRAQIAHGALPPGIPGYDPNLKGLEYNPQKARDLLKQAGYAKGFTVTLWYATTVGWHVKAAQSIQEDLKKVGVTLNLKGVTYTELKNAAGTRRKIEMSMLGWVQDFPDPANFLDVLFNGNNITPTSSQNRAFYSNPEVNKLIEAANVELDAKRRVQLYSDAEKLVVQDAPWVFLFHTERYYIRQPWISGFHLHPMWSARYEYVSVNK